MSRTFQLAGSCKAGRLRGNDDSGGDAVRTRPHPGTPPCAPGVQSLGERRPRRVVRARSRRPTSGSGSARPPSGSSSGVAEPWRADELWRTTCFEAFLRPAGEKSYREWNFAPSGNWAAYDFTAYREGMNRAEVDSPPYIRMEDNFTWWTRRRARSPLTPTRMAARAVRHPRGNRRHQILLGARSSAGDKPDFHAPDCFAARLP